MNIWDVCYPIRRLDGLQYDTHSEAVTELRKEAQGSWAVGTNGHWHGGIHISTASAKNSVLPKIESTDESGHNIAVTPEVLPVPVQCMTTGEIVAYRLAKEYKECDYYDGKKLQYSNSFVLVKSTHKADPDDTSTWFSFFTLYMHLAPMADYSTVKGYKAKKDLKLRKYEEADLEKKGTLDKSNYLFPDKLSTKLAENTQFKLFDIKGCNKVYFIKKGEDEKANPTCRAVSLVQEIDEHGELVGDKFWIEHDKFVEPVEGKDHIYKATYSGGKSKYKYANEDTDNKCLYKIGAKASSFEHHNPDSDNRNFFTLQKLDGAEKFLFVVNDHDHLDGTAYEFGLLTRPTEGDRTTRYWVYFNDNLAEAGTFDLKPQWMQSLIESGKITYDTAVNIPEPLKISSRDDIGYLGHEVYPIAVRKTAEDYNIHIEVIRPDTLTSHFTDPVTKRPVTVTEQSVADFIVNKKNIVYGQNYLVVKVKTCFRQRKYDNNKVSFFIDERYNKKNYFKDPIEIEKTKTEKDSNGVVWYNLNGQGWLPENEIEKISQNDLDKLGFTTIESGSMDIFGLIKSIFNKATETLEKHDNLKDKNLSEYYKSLVNKIDIDGSKKLSDTELMFVYNHPHEQLLFVRDHLIIKHESEWYGGSDKHLDEYKQYIPENNTVIKNYFTSWLDDMSWMDSIDPFSGEHNLWHFNPIEFLKSFKDDSMDKYWLDIPVGKGKITFDAEGNDYPNSIYFTRKASVPHYSSGIVIGNSGVTLGKGLDFGQQTKSKIEDYFTEMEKNVYSFSPDFRKWLINAAGKKKQDAMDYINTLDNSVSKNEQYITRKQQYYLFMATYSRYVSRTRSLLAQGTSVNNKIYKLDLDDYSDKVKDVLVDLTYRGDNGAKKREFYIKALSESEEKFKNKINDKKWKDDFRVPEDRFNRRVEYLK